MFAGRKNMISRRRLLGNAAILAGTAGVASLGLGSFARVWAQENQWTPEAGANLQFRQVGLPKPAANKVAAIAQAFTEATGVPVDIVEESFNDIVPKTAVSVSTNQGPDVILGIFGIAQLFPGATTDVTDVCDYLGNKYGGWAPSAIAYGQSAGKWIAVPLTSGVTVMNYRQSMIEQAGFKEVPGDTQGFLELMKALQASGHPGGFALGRAAGDGNNWAYWALWSHGGGTVDKDDNIIINSPETAAALQYALALSETFVPGCASWNDGTNNGAFIAGEVSLTNNAASIYAVAKSGADSDPKLAELLADMNHAPMPVGPVGRPTELNPNYPLMVMGYSANPQAAKAFAAFFMEAQNYTPFITASAGVFASTLAGLSDNPLWGTDPKLIAVKDAAWRTLTIAGEGTVGEKAAASFADFVVLDMFATVCTGRSSVDDAMKLAERHLQRIYR